MIFSIKSLTEKLFGQPTPLWQEVKLVKAVNRIAVGRNFLFLFMIDKTFEMYRCKSTKKTPH